MKLTQKAISTSHRVLLYGGPKTGKTELAGRLSEKYKLLWIDIENGYSTLTKLPSPWQERIELVAIPDSRVYPIAVETLMKIVKGTEVYICDAHGKVACAVCKKESAADTRICLNEVASDTIVVFDSLTQFTNSAIAHITKNQPDDYKLEYSDWGNLAVIVDKFLSQIQVARYNVVCITHESEVEMEDGKKKLVPVCGSSKSSANTAKYFDHVVYCEVRNKKHIAGSSTGYSMNAVTGSRTDVELEKSVGAGAGKISLLDIFTGWRNGNGMHEHTKHSIDTAEYINSSATNNSSPNALSDGQDLEVTASVVPPPIETLVTASVLTPGQIALKRINEMKAKLESKS